MAEAPAAVRADVASAAGALTEASVRQSCSRATFAKASALQEAGHVVAPALYAPTPQNNTLVGSVRGTWHRNDWVTVDVRGSKLSFTCTCGAQGAPPLCPHAGALLLQWLRDRATFAA